VIIGGTRVSIDDTGDGTASQQFAEALLDAGGAAADPSGTPDVHIVILGAVRSREARLRAGAPEVARNLVLGSHRPAFAKHFASTCAHKASG
jgi:hypothetical protein